MSDVKVKVSKNEAAAVRTLATAEKTLTQLKADLKLAQGVVRTNAKLVLTTGPKVVAGLQKNAGAVVESITAAITVATIERDDAKTALNKVRADEKAAAAQKAKDDKAAQKAKEAAAALKLKEQAAKAAAKAAPKAKAPAVAAAAPVAPVAAKAPKATKAKAVKA